MAFICLYEGEHDAAVLTQSTVSMICSLHHACSVLLQWKVSCDGPLHAANANKNSTVVVAELVLTACRSVDIPIRVDVTNTIG